MPLRSTRQPHKACSTRCSAAIIIISAARATAPARKRVRGSVRFQRRTSASPDVQPSTNQQRPVVRLLRAHLRRQVFSGEEQRQHDRDRALQVVLPGRQHEGVFRQQDRPFGRPRRHALRRSRQRIPLSRAHGRQLHLQRQDRGRPGAAEARTGSDIASPAISSRPTKASQPSTATGMPSPPNSRRSTSPVAPSEWKLRLMSIKVAPAPKRAEEPVKPVEEKKAERTDRRRAQR